MPSTTFHFPPPLLRHVDAVARRLGWSRNKFVIQACQDALAKDVGEWAQGFFDLDLAAEDLSVLRAAGADLERSIRAVRRNRGALVL